MKSVAVSAVGDEDAEAWGTSLSEFQSGAQAARHSANSRPLRAPESLAPELRVCQSVSGGQGCPPLLTSFLSDQRKTEPKVTAEPTGLLSDTL